MYYTTTTSSTFTTPKLLKTTLKIYRKKFWNHFSGKIWNMLYIIEIEIKTYLQIYICAQRKKIATRVIFFILYFFVCLISRHCLFFSGPFFTRRIDYIGRLPVPTKGSRKKSSCPCGPTTRRGGALQKKKFFWNTLNL